MLTKQLIKLDIGQVSAETPKVKVDAESAKALIDSKGWVKEYDEDVYFVWVSCVVPYRGTLFLHFFLCPRALYEVIGKRNVTFFEAITVSELASIL